MHLEISIANPVRRLKMKAIIGVIILLYCCSATLAAVSYTNCIPYNYTYCITRMFCKLSIKHIPYGWKISRVYIFVQFNILSYLEIYANFVSIDHFAKIN